MGAVPGATPNNHLEREVQLFSLAMSSGSPCTSTSSLLILFTSGQAAPVWSFSTWFSSKATLHQRHTKLPQERRVIKSFGSLDPENLKAGKQILVRNGV